MMSGEKLSFCASERECQDKSPDPQRFSPIKEVQK